MLTGVKEMTVVKELIEMKWAGLNHLCNVYIAILIELCILGDE